MKKKRIKRQHVAEATAAALDVLHEVQTLRELEDLVQNGDDSGDAVALNQLDVLQNIINEKLHELFHAVNYMDTFLRQKPKTSRKKPSIVKQAA